jgi:hypothetical protein
MMKSWLAGGLAVALFGLAAPGEASAATAILRGLDKITGHAKDFQAPVGTPVKFGSLQILVRSCQKRPPEETPEVYVYVEISDLKAKDAAGKPAQKRPMLFRGWMFASTPALNALEHPVYDVWAIDCRA